SWLAPHRFKIEKHGYFYGRNTAGNFQMDVSQLRTAFELSSTLTERVRDFRADRLSKIMSGEMPAPLPETMAKIVLHLVPFGAFEPSVRYDLIPSLITPLMLEMNDIRSIDRCRHRYNFDGLLSCVQWFNDLPTVSYL